MTICRMEWTHLKISMLSRQAQLHIEDLLSKESTDSKCLGESIKGKHSFDKQYQKAQETTVTKKQTNSNETKEDHEYAHDLDVLVASTSRLIRLPIKASKPPVFTRKENWAVWHIKFEDEAGLSGWDDEEKLHQILPRIHGPAAYAQLRPGTFKTSGS